MQSSDNHLPCSLCQSERSNAFVGKILNKYDVDYYLCNNCGLLQTENPYWLDEAYNSAIADADTGLLSRNYRTSLSLGLLLYFLFGKHGKYIDNAGGYGVLTRLMRDTGFEFYWHDKFCQNLFARGFDASFDDVTYDAVTAFEVLEHIYQPLEYIEECLKNSKSRTFIFTTLTFSDNPPSPDWWYYTSSTGQHISFYQHKTLEYMASKLGLRLYSNGNWHMFSDKKLPEWQFQTTVRSIVAPCALFLRLFMKSKTLDDHNLLSDSPLVQSQRK